MSVQCLYVDSEYQVDSVDVTISGNIVCALSRTEGNVWDGKLMLLSPDGSVLQDRRQRAGASLCRYSAAHNCIAVARDDGCISIHAADSLDDMSCHRAHDDVVTSVAVSNIEKDIFVSSGTEGMLHLWSFGHGNPVSSSFVNGGVAINDVCTSFSTPHMCSTVSSDGYCRLWDSRQMDKGCVQIAMLNQIGTAVSWSGTADSRCFAGLVDGRVCVIDWRMNGVISDQKLHSARVNRIRVGSDGSGLGGDNLYVTSSDDCSSIVFRESPPTEADVFQTEAQLEELRCLHTSQHHRDYNTDAVLRRGAQAGEYEIISASVDKTVCRSTVIVK